MKLVIWTSLGELLMRHGENGICEACNEILSFTCETPRKDRQDIVDMAFTLCLQDPSRSAEALCHAAFTWHDPDLWVRAVDITGQKVGFAIFPDFHLIWKAISAFGFVNVQAGYGLLCSPICTTELTKC